MAADRRVLSLSCAAALLTLAAPTRAAAPALDVPAGSLGQAVLALGAQAGVSIVVDDARLWRRPVPALRGRMEVQVALRRLLGSAPAEVRAAGPRGWRIVAREAPAPIARPASTLADPDKAEAEVPIIVTASKRDMPLRDFAGTATLIEGADLAMGGAGGTDAILARLATVSSTHLGAGRNKLFIRGIADSSFTGPTQSTVGQYLGDIRLSYNAPDPDLRLYDIASVEVLEGPQGTLYGAGSLGGIIRTVGNAPSPDPAGAMWAGASLTQHGDPSGDLGGMVNVPLAQGVALRAVGYGIVDGGYIDDTLTGKKDVNRTRTAGGRATLRLEPAEGWTVDLGGVIQDIHGADSQYADKGARRLTRASDVDQGFDARYRLAQLVITRDWGDLRLRSSTGLADQQLSERYDASLPTAPVIAQVRLLNPGVIFFPPTLPASPGQSRLFVQTNDTRFFSTETRLWRPMADGFGWVVGVSYIHNRTRLGRTLGPPNLLIPVTGVVNRIGEFTLYGEASYQPAPMLTVTAGARYTRARLAGEGMDGSALTLKPAVAFSQAEIVSREAIVAARTEQSLLPSLGITANVLPRVTLYTRYQEGFRPGGLAVESDYVTRFRNDHVATLEAGMRLGATGRDPFDLTASLSYTRWNDIQADFIDSFGLPTTANIGDGRIWSLAATAGWQPDANLHVDLGFAMNSSRVTDPQPAFSTLALSRMSRVPNVARYAGRAGFDWRHPLDGNGTDLHVSGWARYVGRSRLGIGPVLGEAQGDYVDTALNLRIGRPTLGVTLGVTNLADSVGNRFSLGTPFRVGRSQITPLRPRTLRLGVDAAF
ncbi:TonB-dependent receptor domain-containing protein [Sphingomonas quercus]|uniref:TonB-dependent receptor n=1 Tax=Sphingomonas quercus TaxID=2842451 RepID=A0ABS6BHL1_9SPHN|nr:TonB-dependent receptor [Sphingomonas quercus]MBU3077783.1 TonB-dependent receptor [Sphingomonas quercus]